MSAMELDNDISTVLATMRSETENSDLIQIFYELEDFYERKLWHQLTLSLEQFFLIPESEQLRFQIYNGFVAKLLLKLNPIKATDFLLESFDEKYEDIVENLLVSKNFYIKQIKTNQLSKIDNLDEVIENDESLIYINLQLARYYLLLNDIPSAEKILDALNSKFNNADFESNFNSKINAAFYLTNCQYYKINENYNQFYLNGLLYLSSVDNLLNDEEIKLCYDLCISALLGDKIYNFGELVLHNILNVIKDNEYNWLYHLIINLNSGNLPEFNKWLSIGLKKCPFLTKFEVFLKQKIIIMSLLELISQKSTANKQLTFKEISNFTGTPLNDVEHIIIKCFSLGLIKGQINQLDQVLLVTWLQPRILDLTQIKILYDHLIRWTNSVEHLGLEVNRDGGSIWTGL